MQPGRGKSAAAAGLRGEELAARFLVRRGFRILERNYRCRLGEVDLIVTDGLTLVFVEVRWRKSGRYGGALESIDFRKQRRWIRAARHYLARWPDPPACRFDAILYEGHEGSLCWLRDVIGA